MSHKLKITIAISVIGLFLLLLLINYISTYFSDTSIKTEYSGVWGEQWHNQVNQVLDSKNNNDEDDDADFGIITNKKIYLSEK